MARQLNHVRDSTREWREFGALVIVRSLAGVRSAGNSLQCSQRERTAINLERSIAIGELHDVLVDFS